MSLSVSITMYIRCRYDPSHVWQEQKGRPAVNGWPRCCVPGTLKAFTRREVAFNSDPVCKCCNFIHFAFGTIELETLLEALNELFNEALYVYRQFLDVRVGTCG